MRAIASVNTGATDSTLMLYRIIELTPNGTIDKLMDYDDYIYNEEINP